MGRDGGRETRGARRVQGSASTPRDPVKGERDLTNLPKPTERVMLRAGNDEFQFITAWHVLKTLPVSSGRKTSKASPQSCVSSRGSRGSPHLCPFEHPRGHGPLGRLQSQPHGVFKPRSLPLRPAHISHQRRILLPPSEQDPCGYICASPG